jgi:hypothetical protein
VGLKKPVLVIDGEVQGKWRGPKVAGRGEWCGEELFEDKCRLVSARFDGDRLPSPERTAAVALQRWLPPKANQQKELCSCREDANSFVVRT